MNTRGILKYDTESILPWLIFMLRTQQVMDSSQSVVTFENIPTEIHLLIVSFLDAPDIMSIRQVCTICLYPLALNVVASHR